METALTFEHKLPLVNSISVAKIVFHKNTYLEEEVGGWPEPLLEQYA